MLATTLKPIASGHVFTRNPLMLNMPMRGKCVFSIYGQGYTREQPAYQGEFTAPDTINLAEFIEAIIPPIDDLGEQEAMITYGLHDGSITIEVDDGSQEPLSWQVIAHQGGVSKQNYRKLSQAGTDIFEARFLNPACNFFLTTRTHDWRLNIKETELYPLIFFYPLQGTFALCDIISGNTVSLPASHDETDYHGQLCALNLKAVRQHFLDKYGSITGAFDVLVDDKPAARIAIQEARPQRERYRLKFRNSYGVFEIIELTGEAQWAPDFDNQQDEGSNKRYMPDIDDFSSWRQRLSVTSVIKVSTGYKTNNELHFLLDAIASDECYLLDIDGDPIKVIPSTEELSYPHRPNSPQTFDIELRPVDSDTCITDNISTSAMPARGGLFSEQFTEQFD